MSFIPNEDADKLREVVRDFLDKRSSESEVRRIMQTGAGYDPHVWRQAAEEIGLQGLTIPEKYGGSEASPVELGVVFEEMGAALFCCPFFATTGLAATALLALGDEAAAAEYLPGIASGATIATLTWAGISPVDTTLRAARSGLAWTLSGTADIVIDGAGADLVLVAAQTGAGPSLFAVTGDETTWNRRPLLSMDSTRALAEIVFFDTPAALLGTPGSAGPALRRTADLAGLYLAAEQLGGASHVLAEAVRYAQSRIQFGRPIGSFQSIKHRCADMLIEVESARSVVWHGLWTAVHDQANLSTAASLAQALVSDSYRRLAADNIQIHGGIGFTWEHSAHLYLKRAKSSQLLLGSPATHRARLAKHLTAGPQPGTPGVAPPAQNGPQTGGLEAAIDEFLAEHPVPDAVDRQADRRFREARFDAGLAVVRFAVGHGGRGLNPSAQSYVEERFRRAGAADHTARNVIGLGMVLPTIHAHGTEAQKAKFLRPAFSGEHIWCQLFSEPGAGSDLAALATRALRDGDNYVVTGQKVWTSLGHVARWGILLARTDPAVPKHQGLTYFLVDMQSEGIEVRPLRQLTGAAEFNEVYLTEVRIPAANVLGGVGQGWTVAITTLANERESLGGRPVPRGSGPIGQALATYREAAADGRIDAVMTERLATLWARAEAARLTNVRAAAQIGREPGPEGSIAKLQMAELNTAIYELCVDMSGTAGLLIDGYDDAAPDLASVHGGGDVRKAYLRSLANSIEGGTSEVLRNILGERVLGLPGEPRLDRDIPWNELRR